MSELLFPVTRLKSGFQNAFRHTPFAVVSCLFLLSLLNPSHGQTLEQVLNHVDAQTTMLVKIEAASLDALIEATAKDGDAEQEVLHVCLKKTRELLAGDPIWMTFGFPQTPVRVQVFISDSEGKRIEALNELWDVPAKAAYGQEPPFMIRELSEAGASGASDDSRAEQWTKLMALAGKSGKDDAVQFACLPPETLYEIYRELKTNLPDYFLGGGSSTVLTEGLQAAFGSFDVKTGALHGVIHSASPEAATLFAERANQMATLNRNRISENTTLIESLIQKLPESSFRSDNQQVLWEIPASENWDPSVTLRSMLGPAANRSAVTRLRNLALGVLNYESAQGHLPPPAEARSPEGPKGLSWRVHILPFLGELELYKRFALDEPWDSPTNIKLLTEMPSIYNQYGSRLLAPAGAKPGYTTVVAPIGENTILGADGSITFSAITDGTSNTILLVIVRKEKSVPWTAPQDYVFNRKDPSADLEFVDGKTPVVLCDSSSLELRRENQWLRLFEMNDGAIVELNQ